jgi:hypothetical protein
MNANLTNWYETGTQGQEERYMEFEVGGEKFTASKSESLDRRWLHFSDLSEEALYELFFNATIPMMSSAPWAADDEEEAPAITAEEEAALAKANSDINVLYDDASVEEEAAWSRLNALLWAAEELPVITAEEEAALAKANADIDVLYDDASVEEEAAWSRLNALLSKKAPEEGDDEEVYLFGVPTPPQPKYSHAWIVGVNDTEYKQHYAIMLREDQPFRAILEDGNGKFRISPCAVGAFRKNFTFYIASPEGIGSVAGWDSTSYQVDGQDMEFDTLEEAMKYLSKEMDSHPSSFGQEMSDEEFEEWKKF